MTRIQIFSVSESLAGSLLGMSLCKNNIRFLKIYESILNLAQGFSLLMNDYGDGCHYFCRAAISLKTRNQTVTVQYRFVKNNPLQNCELKGKKVGRFNKLLSSPQGQAVGYTYDSYSVM